jgi:hypothetical protein
MATLHSFAVTGPIRSARNQLTIEFAQVILARGDKAGESATEGRRRPYVAGCPTLYSAPRDAQIVR